MNIIDEKWKQLTAFSNNEELKHKLLNEVKTSYSNPARAYHNLHHIAFMLQLCDEYLPLLHNPAVVGFAVIYHDVVYDTERRDNEENSAILAKKHLHSLNFRKSYIQEVDAFILATQHHHVPEGMEENKDLQYFLDFDLAVLGLPTEQYTDYSKRIRQEYLQYRTHVYKEGRKQALLQLSSTEHLFFTDEFRQRFEQQAKENINNELAELL
jgi:predicted metal-dependent HD superfamily phosphohydrolase